MISEKEYRYWLCKIPDIGRGKHKALLELFGSAEELAHAKEEELHAFNECYARRYFDPDTQEREGSRKDFLSPENIDGILQAQKEILNCSEELHKLKESGIYFLTCDDEDYPEKLHRLSDKPQWLFVKGELPDPDTKSVAIVGARKCSSYGKETAHYLAGALIRNQINVISGLALGVDEYAHRGAIDAMKERQKIATYGGKADVDAKALKAASFGVLGCGVDICYPPKNSKLYYDMTNGYGGLISEYLPGDPPNSWHFPYRNRIISGLADSVVVVEARNKSGSLITADSALEQNKDVWAVPGRMTDPLSEGCNCLIAQGAGIITDIDSFIREISEAGAAEEIKESLPLSEFEKRILAKLSTREIHIEQLTNALSMDITTLAPVLFHLKAEGLVLETSQNYFKKRDYV